MITPEEDLSPRGETSSAFVVKQWVLLKGSADCGKENERKKRVIVDGDLGIVYDESSVNLTCHTSDWVIDLGASFHVTAHCDYFMMVRKS